MLALNRGEKEKFLTVKVAAPEEDILRYLEKQVITRDNPYYYTDSERSDRGQLQASDRSGNRA